MCSLPYTSKVHTMIRIILGFCFLVVVSSQHNVNNFEECLRETEIAKDGQTVINANDPRLKCFTACFMKRIGVMEDGKIDAEKQFDVVKKYTRANLSSLKDRIQYCADSANQLSDECEVAESMKDCLVNRYKGSR